MFHRLAALLLIAVCETPAQFFVVQMKDCRSWGITLELFRLAELLKQLLRRIRNVHWDRSFGNRSTGAESFRPLEHMLTPALGKPPELG